MTKEEYALEWAEYKCLCKRLKYAFIALLTLPFSLIGIIGLLLHLQTFQFLLYLGSFPFVVGVGLLFATLYFAWCQYLWECPRCGERFGRFHDECQNCSLPKWEHENDLEMTAEDIASGRAEWPRPRI